MQFAIPILCADTVPQVVWYSHKRKHLRNRKSLTEVETNRTWEIKFAFFIYFLLSWACLGYIKHPKRGGEEKSFLTQKRRRKQTCETCMCPSPCYCWHLLVLFCPPPTARPRPSTSSPTAWRGLSTPSSGGPTRGSPAPTGPALKQRRSRWK